MEKVTTRMSKCFMSVTHEMKSGYTTVTLDVPRVDVPFLKLLYEQQWPPEKVLVITDKWAKVGEDMLKLDSTPEAGRYMKRVFEWARTFK